MLTMLQEAWSGFWEGSSGRMWLKIAGVMLPHEGLKLESKYSRLTGVQLRMQVRLQMRTLQKRMSVLTSGSSRPIGLKLGEDGQQEMLDMLELSFHRFGCSILSSTTMLQEAASAARRCSTRLLTTR